MTKIAIAGIAGRMGSTIARLAIETPGMEIVGGTEIAGSPWIGKQAKEIMGLAKANFTVYDDLKKAIANAEVFIDFTAPEASVKSAGICADSKVAFVVGTTGLSNEQVSSLLKSADKVPAVFAPNMSLGVNLLRIIVETTAKALGEDYDIEILEAHHKMKADAPSGTALMLAKAAAKARGYNYDDAAVYGREGKTGARPTRQIGVMTLRGGDIVGDHTVLFAGPGERIEIKHQAHTRETFARGALRAAAWVVGKKPTLYSMANVLGLA